MSNTIASSFTNLFNSVVAIFQAIVNAVMALLQSILAIITTVIQSGISLATGILESIASLIGQSVHFVLSNILVLVVLGAGFYWYQNYYVKGRHSNRRLA